MIKKAALAAAVTAAVALPVHAEQQNHEIPPLSEWSYDTLYSNGGLQADDLMDAEVFGESGEEIGSVENLLINDNDQLEAIIAQVGGFWDIGDTHVLIPWSEVNLTDDGLGVPVNEDNVGDYDLFDNDIVSSLALSNTQTVDDDVEAGYNVWKASELLDDYVSLSDGSGYGYLSDILFTVDGDIQAILVDATSEYGGDTYAYPFYGYDYEWSPTDSAYVLDYDAADLDVMEPFDDDRFEDRL